MLKAQRLEALNVSGHEGFEIELSALVVGRYGVYYLYLSSPIKVNNESNLGSERMGSNQGSTKI